MNIPEGIVAFLSPSVALFPDYIPEQWTRPAVTFDLISSTELQDHDGPTGLISERWQFSAFADTPEGALALMRTVRSLFRSVATGGRLGAGVDISGAEIADVRGLGYSVEAKSHGFALDVILRYTEV